VKERDGIRVRIGRSRHEEAQVLAVSGELNAGNAGALATLLQANGPVRIIDLAELEIDGANAALEAVDAVRQLLLGAGTLQILHSPQVLAHTLYRVGLLQSGALELVDPREEEPYG
jgi:anti-anti-sigma regulatory factor